MKLRYGMPEEAGMLPERLDVAGELTKRWVEQNILNSAVILVARRGTIVLHEAFGRLNFEPDSPPIGLDTIYLMTSLTKPVTATALLCLVEDGLVGLNHPVVDYIPEFVGEGKEKVMVRQLLTHTSGITDQDVEKHSAEKRNKVNVPACDDTQHPILNEYLFLGYDAPLSLMPDKEMRYCNYNYDLVGEIIRRVSGMSMDRFVTDRIFEKLGMSDSHYGTPEYKRNRIAVRSDRLTERVKWSDSLLRDWRSGSSGMTSTALDMSIFAQMFLNKGVYDNERILSQSSAAIMTQNQIPGIGAIYRDQIIPKACWGYGWSIIGEKNAIDRGSLRSSKSFGHGGWGTVYLWCDPIYEIIGAFFSTSNNAERTYKESGLFENIVMSSITNH